jgi:hypothetical protein
MGVGRLSNSGVGSEPGISPQRALAFEFRRSPAIRVPKQGRGGLGLLAALAIEIPYLSSSIRPMLVLVHALAQAATLAAAR